MPPRIYTVQEANRVLPLVRGAVRFLREKVIEIGQAQDRLSVLALIGADKKNSPEHGESLENRDALMNLIAAYNERLEKVRRIGCVVKDLDNGLVDFYGRKGNRLIFFCWKLGERRISHWHELEAGFSGRRPLSELEEDEE